MRHLIGCLLFATSLLFAAAAAGQQRAPTADDGKQAAKKIVLIAGPITGHPKQTHEYEKSVILLKHLLDRSPNIGPLKVEAHFHGWPSDPKTLDDADTIVLISDGSDQKELQHPLYVGDRLKTLERQMERGCGLVQFHWSTFNPSRFHDKITEWVGGYFDYETGPGPRKWYSAIQTWEGPTQLGPQPHAISRGVKPFRVREEFYYRLKFRENDPRLKPIVLTRPPGESEDYVVGWAVERKDGGRGFGFTGGHFYANWWSDDFRRLMLNAIVWSAGVEVPADGVQSELAAPDRALIVTGYQHPAHDWRAVTTALLQVLEQDPRLMVDVTENVEDLAAERIHDYDLLMMNYCNWDRPGLSQQARENFVKYLKDGGGLSIIHFANGAFTDTLPNKESDWPEYRTRIARRIWDHRKGISGHDAFGPFQVDITAAKHPITDGLKSFRTLDELYFRQTGELPITPLATARSQETGKDEPMAWAYDYGKGRVFQTVLGHADRSVRMAGALIRRGSSWAARQSPLSFDPPVMLTESYLFRSGSSWTPDESAKREGKPPTRQTSSAKGAPGLSEGKFGKALDARRGGLRFPGNAAYRLPPLTVDCWARLKEKTGFNILVANESKASPMHWELYSYSGSGVFSAFLPGTEQGEYKSSVDICDDRWHHVGMVYEAERLRLYVDGKQVLDLPVKHRGGEGRAEPLAIGQLVSGNLFCQGAVDEVRIRKGSFDLHEIPQAPSEADDTVLLLQHLDELPSPPATSSSQRSDRTTGHWGQDAVGFRWTEQDSSDGRWNQTDLGPHLSCSLAVDGKPIAKATCLKLGDKQQAAAVFDTEHLNLQAGWEGGFLQFDPARYGIIRSPQVVGTMRFHNRSGNAWRGASRQQYRGLLQHGKRSVLSYELDETKVLDAPWHVQLENLHYFRRTLQLSRHGDLQLALCNLGPQAKLQRHNGMDLAIGTAGPQVTAVALLPHDHAALELREGECELRLGETPASQTEPTRLALVIWTGTADQLPRFQDHLQQLAPAEDLEPWTVPGKRLWPQVISTRGKRAEPLAPYVIDTLTVPFKNPYRALMFLTGHDFFSDGRAAVCTLHGDVWLVSGIDQELKEIRWQRFATGLYQPLGLKIVKDQVYVLGRDQITRLHDRDANGEADHYVCFSNRGTTSPGGHDFATCLETDSRGNFYYLRAKDGLLRVSADGRQEAVVADGFRNPFGMGIAPDGAITVSPQEGEWTPVSNIAQVREGGYYGFGGPRKTPERPLGYDPPLCWLPRFEDNSSGGQFWMQNPDWGPLDQQLLHFSFGRCWMLLGLREEVEGHAQGGTMRLPLEFASGICRGRQHPLDGQLYLTGLKGWVSSAVTDGCFQRVRYTGQPAHFPKALNIYANGIRLQFSEPLARGLAEDPGNYSLAQWNYRWSEQYGSAEWKVSQPRQQGRDEVDVRSATLIDEQTVFLEVDSLQPVMQMQISYTLAGADGTPLEQTIHNTINHVPSRRLDIPKPTNPIASRPGLLARPLRNRLQPGLITRWQSAAGTPRDSHVSRLAAILVAEGELPSPFVTRQESTAILEGYLKLKLKDVCRFRLEGSGLATLTINDQQVARQESEQTVTTEPVALHKGYNRIRVSLRGPPRKDAVLRVLWSCDRFDWEPLPTTMLWHDPADPQLAAGRQRRRGRTLFAERSCLACHSLDKLPADESPHGSMPERRRDNPSLEAIGSRLEANWLAHWLAAPQRVRPRASMPSMFDPQDPEQRQAIADIVAYLDSQKGPHPGDQAPANDDKDTLKAGQQLFENLGCISCHWRGEPGEDDFNRLSLHYVGDKFQPGALERFLRAPAAHYRWTKMMDFGLSEPEAAAVASYLRSPPAARLPRFESPPGDAKRGRELAARRCAACHELPGIARPTARIALELPDGGCLRKPHTQSAPDFRFSDSDRTAIKRFLREAPESLAARSRSEIARRWTEALRCTACHNRDETFGAWPEILVEEGFQGRPPEQLPTLTWTGEKLQTDWLEQFLAGEIPYKPRPWLTARMPRLPTYATELAAGLAAEHGLRGPERTPLPEPSHPHLEQGSQLSRKTGGLDCRQCHALADQDLRLENKAQGIGLSYIRPRLRYSYYRRWIMDPLRVDPGTKMPRFAPDGKSTPIKEIAGGDARAQFDALWSYIQTLAPVTNSKSGTRSQP